MTGFRNLIRIAACLAALSPAAQAAAQDGAGLRISDLQSIQIYAVGGALVPFMGSSSIGSLDLDAGTTLATSSGGFSSVTPLLGARVHVPLFWYMSDENRLGFNVYFEGGLQTAFGAQSFLQPFANLSPTGADYGTATIKEYWQVPLLLGISVPVVSDVSGPRALLDVYGGITVDSWAHSIQGAEANAADGSGFSAANRRLTLNPTVGLGVRMPLGSVVEDTPLFFGLNAEVQFRPGSVVTAYSSDFNVSYTSSVAPYANLAVMARIGFAFGGR
jgi:hypothetical protein